MLALLGLGFLVMLGIVGGSVLALLLFGALVLVGAVISFLAVRDLTGLPTEISAVVLSKKQRPEGGNPVYEVRLKPNPALKPDQPEISYNVTRPDFERLRVNDRVIVRYSAFFKLLIDINPDR